MIEPEDTTPESTPKNHTSAEQFRFVVTAEAIRVGEDWVPRGTGVNMTFVESQSYLAGAVQLIHAVSVVAETAE